MQLEAHNIRFRYENGPWLINDLSVSLKKGEVVGLTGPSGRGKTTLCRILAGLEHPLKGSVTVNGQSLPKKGYKQVQLVYQHPEKAVNPRWKMNKILHEGGEIDQSFLEMLGIKNEWLTRWPHELSGGQLQRFCVLRALGSHTKYLIADEMTTMLDALTQAQIWHAVLEIIKERNMGLLIVSHNVHLIERLCHRVIQL